MDSTLGGRRRSTAALPRENASLTAYNGKLWYIAGASVCRSFRPASIHQSRAERHLALGRRRRPGRAHGERIRRASAACRVRAQQPAVDFRRAASQWPNAGSAAEGCMVDHRRSELDAAGTSTPRSISAGCRASCSRPDRVTLIGGMLRAYSNQVWQTTTRRELDAARALRLRPEPPEPRRLVQRRNVGDRRRPHGRPRHQRHLAQYRRLDVEPRDSRGSASSVRSTAIACSSSTTDVGDRRLGLLHQRGRHANVQQRGVVDRGRRALDAAHAERADLLAARRLTKPSCSTAGCGSSAAATTRHAVQRRLVVRRRRDLGAGAGTRRLLGPLHAYGRRAEQRAVAVRGNRGAVSVLRQSACRMHGSRRTAAPGRSCRQPAFLTAHGAGHDRVQRSHLRRRLAAATTTTSAARVTTTSGRLRMA